jgi:predicted cobalt transporter CbtA
VVGLLAGLLAFGFARVFGEPLLDRAIAFEEHEYQHSDFAEEHEHQHPDSAEGPELVSRAVQSSAGLLVACVVYGSAIGGLFALVFAYWNRRIATLSPRGTALLLAALCFVTISLVPSLIYPANPPAVGREETIQARTALYFGTLAISIATMALSVALGRRLLVTRRLWTAAVNAALAYVCVMLIAGSLLPEINEVPADFSAQLLWKFRTTSMGMNLVLWATLGILYGYAAERVLQRARAASSS